MRPIPWAGAIRRFATRVHRRTEHLPRLPFVIALAVAAAVLVAAIEAGPEYSRAIEAPDELALEDAESLYENAYVETEVELEIVEHGFGLVTGADGEDRLSVGAIMRNPNDTEVTWATLALTGVNSDGERRLIEDLAVADVPAGAEVPFGYVFSAAFAAHAGEPRLEVTESVSWEANGEPGPAARELLDEQWDTPIPEVTVIDTVPLFSPEGYRVTYDVDAARQVDNYDLEIFLVFRGEDGAIVGGMRVWGDPFTGRGEGWPYGFHAAPEGLSRQYVELPVASIPAGADLDRIEIGAGR